MEQCLTKPKKQKKQSKEVTNREILYELKEMKLILAELAMDRELDSYLKLEYT
jgi:hypothetical protein